MRFCNSIIEIGLIAILIFAPLALGAVQSWAIGLLKF